MKLIDMSVADFTNEVDSNSPAPGGGSVSALASDIGVSLARMMAHLSFEKKKFEQLDEKTKEEFKARFDKLGEIRKELSTLVDKDTESFNEFMKAVKMPKETEEQNKLRAKAIQEATIFSIEVPYKTASLSLEALRLLDFLIKNGNQNAITDIGVGTLMLSAGMEGAILNVKVNLGQIKDKQIYDKYRDGCKEILSEGNEIKDNIISNIHKQLD
ncbi:MAG: cyclodeaminase/cyclohydrolase family protein [Clostridiales bacterium]|jgi:formiminotetrahydrofolate cyclodeaminase|uniref:cyclodeaminase/cyclohydrolase family protein n=1 Tax=Clostridia TaxID=186801 RepID=UPI0025D46236|nr:cyclodeaminase/cyclohydrolase family protein [uncultured Intestinibacter sp.]MDU1202230.1 cyclodeaminase/cyclohydrolase family protein [Clostridiales bacterium]